MVRVIAPQLDVQGRARAKVFLAARRDERQPAWTGETVGESLLRPSRVRAGSPILSLTRKGGPA